MLSVRVIMKAFISKTSLRKVLRRAIWWCGVLLVIGVNAFFFFSEPAFVWKLTSSEFQAFVSHASSDHRINESPFSLYTPVVVPLAAIQSLPPAISFPNPLSWGLPVSLLFIFTIITHSVCLLKGEENKGTQILLAIHIPPPKQLC